MEIKTEHANQSPLSDIPLEVQKLMVQYLGVAHSALIPFLPQSYFTGWDIVICLWQAMSDGIEMFEECLNAFGEIQVKALGCAQFMIRSDEEIRDHISFTLTGLGKDKEACILLLALYASNSSFVSLLVRRRDMDSKFAIHVPPTIDEKVLSRPNWLRQARAAIAESCMGDTWIRASSIMHDIIILSPEMIEKEHYLKHKDNIMLMSGDYRYYLGMYFPGDESIRRKILRMIEVPVSSIAREMGITMTEDEIIRSENKYLLNGERLRNNLTYLIRLFSLSFPGEWKGVRNDNNIELHRRMYNTYPRGDRNASECGRFLYEYFAHHIDVQTPTTEEQRSVMRRILPCSVLSISENIALCTFFGIDFGDCILDSLRNWGTPQYGTDFDVISNSILEWMEVLQKRDGERKGKRRSGGKYRRHVKKGKGHARGDGGHVKGGGEISQCDKFCSSLLECCTHIYVLHILRSCLQFVRYITTDYKSHLHFCMDYTRQEATRIIENNLCMCHWDREKKFNKEVCRTRLFILSQFGCFCVDDFIETISAYRRGRESTIDVIIDMRIKHAIDYICTVSFDRERRYEPSNIIALFPRKDVPRCDARKLCIRTRKSSLWASYNYRDDHDQEETHYLHYGKSLYKHSSSLRRAIRRALSNPDIRIDSLMREAISEMIHQRNKSDI